MDLCIFAVTGGNFTGYYRFLKGFYGLADIPTISREKIDRTLENKHPAWLDDIIVVTKGSKQKHMEELIDVLTKLENAGYRLSKSKSKLFKTEIEWIGHKIDQNDIRPVQDKLLAIKELKEPKNEKEIKSFLGAIQYLSKYIENLSAQTDILRQLLKKDSEWNWTTEHTKTSKNLKQKITEIPCLAHYISDYPNIFTTDARTKGLGATLWQEQQDGKLNPIGFACRFLSDTEKKYAIKELELLAVVWGIEHFRLYIYGKPIKLLTDHQALETLIKRNRSNKTYSTRLTKWLDRLAHFSISVSLIAGKHSALTDYLSRNPTAPPQANDAYDEEYVVNNIVPHLKIMNKYGCLSNQINQSQRENLRNKPKQSRTRDQTAIACLNRPTNSCANSAIDNSNSIMDAHTIDNLELTDPYAETRYLIARWRDKVTPGVYRMSGGRWKKYHEPRFLRNERKIIEEQLQIAIRNSQTNPSNQPEGFQPQERRNEQWTVDPFWETDRPQRPQALTENYNTPPPRQQQWTPMEEGEIRSESEQDQSVLEVPAINWAKYVGVKSVQYIKMGHAPKVDAIEQNNWDLGNAVRETEKQFATDLQLLMTETTNDPSLFKTLVCLERQQHENIPEEYSIYKKKISSRHGLAFYEDEIIVPKNLRTTVISLLHKEHKINKMSIAARHFCWPRITEAIQKKCDNCFPCKMAGKTIKPNTPSTEKNQIPPLNKPNEDIQLDFIGLITEKNRRFYILLSMDRFSKWPAASFCKSTESQTVVKILEQYITSNGIPKTIRTDKATAFTSRLFREFCREHQIKLIYGTRYIHTPTGLVERGVRTLKEIL